MKEHAAEITRDQEERRHPKHVDDEEGHAKGNARRVVGDWPAGDGKSRQKRNGRVQHHAGQQREPANRIEGMQPFERVTRVSGRSGIATPAGAGGAAHRPCCMHM